MITGPRLEKFGDKTERQYWGRLRKLVPHYETFWQLYVVPLRAPKSIWFRFDINPSMETLAISSYSTFSALGRAYEQVYSNKDNYRYLEDVYMTIQRSAEIGVKLIDAFASLERDATHSASTLGASDLRGLLKIDCPRIAIYYTTQFSRCQSNRSAEKFQNHT